MELSANRVDSKQALTPLNGKEALEAHLHLLLRHGDALDLAGTVSVMDMRWDIYSQVNPKHDASIAPAIKRQETDRFAGRRAHSPSWLDYIKRHDKTRFDAAQEQRETLFDAQFAPRLQARLHRLQRDQSGEPAAWADTERIVGKAVSDALIDEVNMALTSAFLTARGSAHCVELIGLKRTARAKSRVCDAAARQLRWRCAQSSFVQ